MNRVIWSLVLFVSLATSLRGDIDPAAVRRAMESGIRYLKNQERSWEYPSYPTGRTALCILALVNSGVPKNDPAITRGMDFLRSDFTEKTYCVALRTMVFCLVDPQRDGRLIERHVDWLVKAQNDRGGWGYGSRGVSGDNSNAQFAVLALYEAERVGVTVPKEVWRKASDYWMRGQNQDGSWGYVSSGDSRSSLVRGSMVCAGLGSLLMSSAERLQRGAYVRGEAIVCADNARDPIHERLDAGLAWLADRFSASANPGLGSSYYYYYMYGLERVGRLTGHRLLRQTPQRGAVPRTYDWYREGTDALLKSMDRATSDHWSGSGEDDITATAFALLFLSKGRWPVLLSKIDYGSDATWNVHPNDVAHLTRFTEQRWKLDLTWQTIRLDAATVEDLEQSPVLYLCGSKSPLTRDAAATARDAAKIRAYIDQGGFLFAEAQPNDTGFDAGFRALMNKVFEDSPDNILRLLPPEHPIWTAELPLSPDQIRPIEGIDFGCRTCVVYAPAAKTDDDHRRPSLSCLWEVTRFHLRGEAPYPPSVNAQIDGGLTLGINILAYATNRELKTKDERLSETLANKLGEAESRRGRIYLGMLDHSGGAQVAPRAFPNLLQWVGTKMGVSVDVRVDTFAADDPALSHYPVVVLHGRTEFSLTDPQRTALRQHVERGGTLIAASICSSAAFTAAFQREMQATFPDRPMASVPLDDVLWSEEYGGHNIKRLTLRTSQRTPESGGLKTVERDTTPELQGIKVDERWGVLFSQYDISCALERGVALDCRGYTPASAMQLAVNMLLYALEHE